MTGDDIEALREEMAEQRREVREYLAVELGGDPEDYDAEQYFASLDGEPVADGGGDEPTESVE